MLIGSITHIILFSCYTDHKVVTMSQEREEILEEFHALHCLNNTKNNNGSHNQLTHEEMAKSHSQCIEKKSSLVHGIDILAKEEDDHQKERADTMSKEIMQLVGKNRSQRVFPDMGNDSPRRNKKKWTGGMEEKGKSMSIIDGEKSANQDDERNLSRRRRSEQSNHDSESFSVCTVLSKSGDGDENSHVDEPYIVDDNNISSNSLLGGASP